MFITLFRIYLHLIAEIEAPIQETNSLSVSLKFHPYGHVRSSRLSAIQKQWTGSKYDERTHVRMDRDDLQTSSIRFVYFLAIEDFTYTVLCLAQIH